MKIRARCPTPRPDRGLGKARRIGRCAGRTTAYTVAHVNKAPMEAKVNKLVCTLTAALVLAGVSAYGQSTSKPAPTKHQTKAHAISDKTMDKVTAAGEEQESIAADHSTVTENNSGTVNLSGAALMGASGINIVNSSDSLVGNGVNVMTQGSADAAKVSQTNSVSQSSRTEASLNDYQHGPDSQSSKVTTSDEASTSTSAATLNATLNHSETENDSDTATNVVTSASTNSAASTKNNSETESSSSNHTFNGNDTSTSAATANSASSSTGGKSSNVGGSTSTNSTSSAGNTSASNDTATHNLSTDGAASASNSTSNHASTDVDAATSAHQSSETETSASTSNSNSSKNDSATHNTTDTDSSTENTVATLAWTKNTSSSKHNINNSTTINNVQGAVSFESASAQNIAVDNSSISATNNYSVILAGTAEENAKAINIVNAAGGMVGNGVNIARTTAANATPTLSQVNSISQAR